MWGHLALLSEQGQRRPLSLVLRRMVVSLFVACYLPLHHISYRESGIIPAQIYVGLSLCLGLKTNSRLIVFFLLNS